jgi:hypothetical protein
MLKKYGIILPASKSDNRCCSLSTGEESPSSIGQDAG